MSSREAKSLPAGTSVPFGFELALKLPQGEEEGKTQDGRTGEKLDGAPPLPAIGRRFAIASRQRSAALVAFLGKRIMQASGRWVQLAICGVLALAFAALAPERPQAQQAAPAAGLEPLTIVSASGRHEFQVEVMRTPEQRARGLMHRQFMPADRGMLFDFKRTEPVAMWMQNTYISLDMLFIRADGTVARIAERTEPLSTRTIPSGEPVLSVLEINGGVAEKLGIKAGDKVEHALFRR